MRERRPEAANGKQREVDREAITRLARSGEAQKLMDLLRKQGSVTEAAKAAAAGDAGQLMGMMDQLMRTREGAELVKQIQNRAKQAGL